MPSMLPCCTSDLKRRCEIVIGQHEQGAWSLVALSPVPVLLFSAKYLFGAATVALPLRWGIKDEQWDRFSPEF